jgi:hypothetical protein
MLSGRAAVALAKPPIIQAGAPGDLIRNLSAEEAIKIAVTGYSLEDVRFTRVMMPHHQQALAMPVLALDRAGQCFEDGGIDEDLSVQLKSLAAPLQEGIASNAITTMRCASLAGDLLGPADRLQ